MLAASGIAGTAKTQNNVLTFTIGMAGADFTLLDSIAQASGTDCKPKDMGETCDASNNADFLAALETIRSSVVVTHTETRTEVVNKPVQCEFKRPDPQDGEMFDSIKNGVPPDFNMVPWKDQLKDDQIWNVVNYIRSIEKKK